MVLVVDDDPAIATELRAALDPDGPIVDWAPDVDRALALLDREPRYCCIVLDLALGRGSGFDVLHYLGEKKLEIPTIVVTSKLPSYVREMLDAQHVKLVFPKPIEPRLLGAVVFGLCSIEPGAPQ